MISKKVCLLGGFAVGKTSLVARFVHGVFSEKYLTTIGVKIDKRSMTVDDDELDLVIWDIYGEDDYQRVRMSYLRGASGLRPSGPGISGARPGRSKSRTAGTAGRSPSSR